MSSTNLISKFLRAAPQPDRRTTPRTTVSLPALLIRKPGSARLPCTVRDISAGGAQVTFAVDETVPEMVWLVIARQRLAYRAKAVMRSPGTAGLIFGGERRTFIDDAELRQFLASQSL